ncbi:MAG: hypothetical protein NTY33_01790 [Candidatus Moranbacteria bacterium]|nr:hypothetical protein [Candidatus Moranbacteria bacterium]
MGIRVRGKKRLVVFRKMLRRICTLEKQILASAPSDSWDIGESSLSDKIRQMEKAVLAENRWDTWHVGGVREHLVLPARGK